MSRLVNYGIGDAIDRLTILALKRLYGEAAGKPVEHFQKEATVLHTQITARTLNGAWFAPALDLAAVNGALWRAEDELRDYRRGWDVDVSTLPPFAGDIVRLAFRVQELNDQRAALVEVVNKLVGEHQGSEKAHVGE